MTISGSAVQGIHQAESQLESVALKVARPATPSAAGSDQVDLSELAVKLMQAKNQVGLNVKILQAADQMDQAILNILG